MCMSTLFFFLTDWRHLKVPHKNEFVTAGPGTLHVNEENYQYLALHFPQLERSSIIYLFTFIFYLYEAEKLGEALKYIMWSFPFPGSFFFPS